MAQTILIIGVKNLGRDIARRFAARGWRVVCAARTQSDVDALAAEVKGVGVACDLADPASLRALAAHEIDLCVASQSPGGRFGSKPLLEIADEELDRGYAVSVRGTWNLMKAIGPGMIARGRGTFVQMGTSSGLRTKEGFAALGANQFALRALVQVAAREWRAHGVHVAYVAIDGAIESEKSRGFGMPKDRTIDPNAIADACAFLHEQGARAYTHEIVLRPSSEGWTAPT